MTHPTMYDDADPYLAHVREICLALPRAAEKISHGRPVFFTKKIFVGYGAVVKGDHHSPTYDHSIVIAPDPAEADALRQDPRFFVPAYWGPWGWLAFDLAAAPVDWDEVAEVVESSYRLTALPAAIRELDARAT